MIAGARVEVAPYKRDPMDFVLWKPSSAEEPGWDSPWGRGRPGWHLECSAMSEKHLGETFDIHGGGVDLVFPHNENEIAQSRCAHGTQVMANYWMHNGFLQVEGRKMAKSEGNFVTVRELLHTDRFGDRNWPGEVLRLAMLMTHYRQPIDFSVRRLEEAESRLLKWKSFAAQRTTDRPNQLAWTKFLQCLLNDLDASEALSGLDDLSDSSTSAHDSYTVFKALKTLGFKNQRSDVAIAQDHLRKFIRTISKFSENDWQNITLMAGQRPRFKSGVIRPEVDLVASILAVGEKIIPKISKNYQGEVERLQNKVADKLGGSKGEFDKFISQSINQRRAFIAEKNWTEADRIRDELLAEGIQLKDSKDSETGERVTTWEVKR